MSYDMECEALAVGKTAQWRETLLCWVIAGFHYAARDRNAGRARLGSEVARRMQPASGSLL